MRRWFEPLATAWTGVVTHKLRSSLTILGVVIGVGAVIALMSIGRGTEQSVVSSIESLGADLLIIRPGSITAGGIRSAAGSATTLTLEDAAAIADDAAFVATVAPSYSSGVQIVAGGQNMGVQVTGVTPEYQQVLNLEVAEGSFISEYDYERSNRIAVIGANVKETLFGDANPLGQSIRAGNYIVHVVGVLESQGASLLGATDDAILVPLTTMQLMVGQPRTSQGEHVVSTITASVTERASAEDAVEEITSILRFRHQLGPGAEDDFSITSLEEIISRVSDVIGTMTLLLGAIAAISLLVGGIGVMNIMLVSVVERTREIGIRKALGARERDIWSQFLIEAAMLTFTGGLIGIALGWAASTLVARTGFMPSVVSADIVIMAVSVSVGIGLFFGFYPAWHASRLNPIEALRAE
jgi:putative ABC transport system permease protein